VDGVGKARSTPIGYVPTSDALDLGVLDEITPGILFLKSSNFIFKKYCINFSTWTLKNGSMKFLISENTMNNLETDYLQVKIR
jgi:hypothetical protein